MKTIAPAVLCCFLFITSQSPLQSQENVPKYILGFGIGTIVYQGDLTPEDLGSYRTLRPSVNLFASKIFSPSFAARLNFLHGQIRGNDAAYKEPEYRQHRNFNFTSPVTELSIQAEWNPMGRNYRSKGFTPYLFGGIGYSFLGIRRDWSRVDDSFFDPESGVITGLPEDIAQEPRRGLLVLPVGIGLRYFFNDNLGLNAESSYRVFSNDYLDGFSMAANPEKSDHYYTHHIGIIYRIGRKNTLACPVIRY